MKYRDIIGYSKKQSKKKVIKEKKKPTVVDTIKEEFGYKKINESVWDKRKFGEPLPTVEDYQKEYNKKHNVNEGPAYEYANLVKKIEKAENQQAKEVNNLVKLLGKKGLKREATDLAAKYMRGMRDFKDFMTKMMRKLV